MADAETALEAILEAELFQEPPAAARAFEYPLRDRFGTDLAAVLFYGSCLRKQGAGGVLDFYALVDDYDEVYEARRLELANRWLPPNVFYLETRDGDATLSAKVAVMSRAHFRLAMAGSWIRPGFWARFCQPAVAVRVRDGHSRRELVSAFRDAACTAVEVGLAHRDLAQPFDAERFWQDLFRGTYGCELRPESPETIASLYAAAPVRYEAVLDAALEVLAQRGATIERSGGEIQVRGFTPTKRLARRRAKLIGAAALLKTAFTFGDWLPYTLWKLERHTGTHLRPTSRQRRHPLLFGWPLILRVLWKRELR
jgi:hypothetical protein